MLRSSSLSGIATDQITLVSLSSPVVHISIIYISLYSQMCAKVFKVAVDANYSLKQGKEEDINFVQLLSL